MLPGAVSDVIIESADAVYDYLDFMQFATDPPAGVSVTGVSSCTVAEDYAVLKLESVLNDTSGIKLMVDSDVIPEDSARFTRYDEVSKTIVVHPPGDILQRMAGPGTKVRIISDMKFLIIALGDFYKRYGKYLTLPLHYPETGAPEFPEGSRPTRDQKRAVDCILGSRMSYIWGAPGTGKTQLVLSTCIRACLDAGMRVAVFAPTNNSVEQVLSGLIKSFGDDSSILDGIVRLGVPTREFVKAHPSMCENNQADRRMQQCFESADNLSEVMYERCISELEQEVIELARDIMMLEEGDDGKVILRNHRKMMKRFQDLSGLFLMFPETRDLVRMIDHEDIRVIMGKLVSFLYEKERPVSNIDEYDSWSDADLIGTMLQFEQDAEEFRKKTIEGRVHDSKIIASTPQQFISRFRPKGSEEDPRMELDVDHIFLDEAGYCGLLQALSLFTNGVPVTFLGDHMQLPPVSQIDEALLEDSARRNGTLKDAYLWSMSALYCEQMLTDGPGSLKTSFLESIPPAMTMTGRADLTESHRFGSNLAAILDRYVYRNGITGVSGSDLKLECIDAICEERDGRENKGEAFGIREYLDRNPIEPDKVAILTPYTVQLRLLRKVLGRKYRDSVMTVHSSQGREWPVVILSVADNGVESRDVPFRFTSSATEIGVRVINTAVSRAKDVLVIACDRDFWSEKGDEMIGGLLREVPEDKVFSPGTCRHQAVSRAP